MAYVKVETNKFILDDDGSVVECGEWYYMVIKGLPVIAFFNEITKNGSCSFLYLKEGKEEAEEFRVMPKTIESIKRIDRETHVYDLTTGGGD